MPQPTKELLLKSGIFPNCVCCIDEKHIRYKCPKNSGTMFYNYYKQYFSVVLQAVADANYKLQCIKMSGYGKQSDGGTFASTTLYEQLENGYFLPEKKTTSSRSNPSARFPLKSYLMKPYSKRNLSPEEEIFNYRLSRCRRTVECSFGIMEAKWRLLNKPIES